MTYGAWYPPKMTRRRGSAPFKEVWALKTLVTKFFDPSAIVGQWPRILKRSAVRTVILTVVALVLLTGLAVAGDPDRRGDRRHHRRSSPRTPVQPTTAELGAALGHLTIGVNMFFVIVGVMLIFFMQAGFMLVETGFCRSKNAAHVAMTNFIVFGVGALVYWMVGFAIQFGGFG